jgi:hypothetical protein
LHFDLIAPVVSSNTIETVPLDVAQKMKPRPPSTLMYYKNNCNTNNQLYQEAIMKDSFNNLLEDELNETVLWMEHPHQQEYLQRLIVKSVPSSNNDQDEYTQQSPSENNSVIDLKQTKQTKQHCNAVEEISSNSFVLLWVNSFLAPNFKIQDLSHSIRSGEILIQLLENLSGKTIDRCDTQVSASMTMLDNIVEAFKFMSCEGIVNSGYTIKGNYYHKFIVRISDVVILMHHFVCLQMYFVVMKKRLLK